MPGLHGLERPTAHLQRDGDDPCGDSKHLEPQRDLGCEAATMTMEWRDKFTNRRFLLIRFEYLKTMETTVGFLWMLP